ncbi:MAG: TrmH family RNA methyltransferase [Candidatus Kerfeldbacteria bacterium]
MNNKIFYLILPNIRSRFNVGSIFRTADAAGIDKIFLTGITPAPPHPKIDKVALGAEKNIPFEKITQTNHLLKKLAKQGFQIIALEQSKKSIDYTKLKPKYPIALVVGNEVKGLDSSILKNCHTIIDIPMHGKKESLNVSVALGITVFNIINK